MQQLSLDLDLMNVELSPATNPDWFQAILSALHVGQETAWPDQFGQSLRSYLQQQGLTPVKTLSLFSGGGGLDIAFHDAGFEIVQMVELEAKYIQTLQHNTQVGHWLEGSQPICTDIRDYSPDPDLHVDFIIGGPPCQTFSAAGRRAAGVPGTTDARGTLFQEYVRILKILQPKGFLFENVYGITGANGGQAWQEIQAAFQGIGYRLYFRILDAADYGVPQHRERLFIVGVQQGSYLFPYPTHGLDSLNQTPYYSAQIAVQGADTSEVEAGLGGRFGHLLTDIPPGLNYSFYTREMGYPNPIFSWRSKFSDFLYKADPDTPVRTLKAQGGQYTGPFSWENRRFSLAELKRLQTIPDAYEMIGNRQAAIAQIGNSVPPQLGRILALSILDHVMQFKLPFRIEYLPENKKLGFRQRKRQLTEIYSQKARMAIAELSQNGTLNMIHSSPYTELAETIRFLSLENFSWTQDAVPDAIKIHLHYDLNPSAWSITASTQTRWDDPNQFVIDVYPSGSEPWVLETPSVQLCAKQLDTTIFTALWKALEEKLYEATGKADLVQLSGYYQYNARIRSDLTFSNPSPPHSLWHILRCVTRSIGTATQLNASTLADQWSVHDDELLFYLQALRAMGYEVRSHNTNPQIPAHEYLIPYVFPTLNPKSVQLRKVLSLKD